MNKPWLIRTLGRFQITRENISVPLKAKKARAMLLLLAVEPGHLLPRTRLTYLLWPDHDEASARQNLRQLLAGLKRDLGSEANTLLEISDENIGLQASSFSSDLAVLERAGPQIEDLKRAADAYLGLFGEDLDLDEPDFDDWLRRERDRYRDIAINRFRLLVDQLLAQGEKQESYRRCLQLYAIDPLREDTHRALLALDNEVNGRASALARYDAIKAMLIGELGVAPEQQTRALIDQLRQQDQIYEAAPLLETIKSDISVSTDQPRARGKMAMARAASWFAAASILAAAVLLSILYVRSDASTTTSPFDSEGKISVAIMPFTTATGVNIPDPLLEFREDLLQHFASMGHISAVLVPRTDVDRSPSEVGRLMKSRYVMTAVAASDPEEPQIRIRVTETNTSELTYANIVPLRLAMDRQSRRRAANSLTRAAYKEIVLDRARRLPDEDDQTGSLLIRAEAASLRGRFGPLDPDERLLYERVRQRDPENYLAIRGLSRLLVVGVALERSRDRENDLRLADAVLEEGNQLYPNNVHIIFIKAMIDKVRRRYEQSLHGFNRTIELDTTYPQAQIQRAHLLALLGRADEAFPIMADAMNMEIKDFSVGGTAYLAAETALLARKDEDAVRWLRLSVQENASIARAHALLASALELTGRSDEATLVAQRARDLNANYTPDAMRKRGGASAHPTYREGQVRIIDAFSTAYSRTRAKNESVN